MGERGCDGGDEGYASRKSISTKEMYIFYVEYGYIKINFNISFNSSHTLQVKYT